MTYNLKIKFTIAGCFKMYIPRENRKIKQGIKNFTNNIKKNIKT